ncbi:MAG: STAS domain-containing protein [Solirubrobacteraceae bacterium]
MEQLGYPAPSAPVGSVDRSGEIPGALSCRLQALPGGVAHIVVGGELDLATAPILERELRAADARGHPVVLDLRGVWFCDSAGIQTVVTATRRARKCGRRLVVVPGSSQLRRIFTLTGIDAVLEIVEDPATIGAAD